jgi:hypothetical protein
MRPPFFISLPLLGHQMLKDAYPAMTIVVLIVGLIVVYWRGWSS